MLLPLLTIGKPLENGKYMGKPWENDGLMGFYGIYPMVMTNITMENHHLSWENRLFLWCFSTAMLNYQRVYVDIHTRYETNLIYNVYRCIGS